VIFPRAPFRLSLSKYLLGQTLAKRRYLCGCAAAPQACKLALWQSTALGAKLKTSSPYVGNSNNAWNVNFNNGNVNNNNRNNNNYVRLVR
jgi:hypothetical protein